MFNINKEQKMICEITENAGQATKVCLTDKNIEISDFLSIVANIATIITFIIAYRLMSFPKKAKQKLSGINKEDLAAINIIEAELNTLKDLTNSELITLGLVENGDFLGKLSIPRINIAFSSDPGEKQLKKYNSNLNAIPINTLTKEGLLDVTPDHFNVIKMAESPALCKSYLAFIEAEVIARRALRNLKKAEHSYFGLIQVHWKATSDYEKIDLNSELIEKQFNKVDFLVSTLLESGSKKILVMKR